MFSFENYAQFIHEKLAHYLYANGDDLAAVMYPSFGLAGETGETAGKIEQFLADPYLFSDESAVVEVIKEMGDILWYVTRVATETGGSLMKVLTAAEKLRETGYNSHLYGEARQVSAARLMLRISSYQGAVSETLKKAIRDEKVEWSGSLSESRKEKIQQELVLIVHHLEILAEVFGVSLQEVARRNMNKLSSRLERNVITGDGDNR